MSARESAAKNFYAEDVVSLARRNENYRQVLYTAGGSQLVLMSIPVGCDIGEEVHEGIDQILAFVEGEGEAVVEGEKRRVRAGSVVVIPSGTRHNFINRGGSPLKLITVYAPPEHPDGTLHRTKEEADEYERAHHGKE